ncbi:unnamed protein product [Rhizopus stolonifer]
MVELNKKIRLEKKQGPKHSKIYQPFRAIGYVTNETPYVINSLGQTYQLTTSVGKSFQTYDLGRMNLLFVSTPTEQPITAMASFKKMTFVASGNNVFGYLRGKQISQMGGQGSFTICRSLFLVATWSPFAMTIP